MLEPTKELLIAIDSLKGNKIMMDKFITWLQFRLTTFYSYLAISDEPKDVYRFQGRISELSDLLEVILNSAEIASKMDKQIKENELAGEAHS